MYTQPTLVSRVVVCDFASVYIGLIVLFCTVCNQKSVCSKNQSELNRVSEESIAQLTLFY